jgi:isopentenyldiphosphate isomerase
MTSFDQERPGSDMIVDTVNHFDFPIGTIVRHDVLETGHNFRVAHLFLFNSSGELLIQQLSAKRERHPLAWGSSVACYLFAGETYDDAIRRRTAQELGREIAPISFVGRTRMQDVESEKFIGLFRANDDGPFTIDREHIERVQFLPVPEIVRLMTSGERRFTPTFLHLISFYLGAPRPLG